MAQGGARDRDSNSNLDAPLGEQARPGEPLQSPLGDLLVSVGFLALVLPLFFHLTVEKTATADEMKKAPRSRAVRVASCARTAATTW